MTMQARGEFEVKLTPQASDTADDGPALGRFTLDKQFRGDLQASSRGEMLTAGGSVKGSAGYVAVERVSGTLHGRRGAFALQHSGTMIRGEGQLSIHVVPDSASGELAGLSGRMDIRIADGRHSYVFDYQLPGA